MQTLRDECRQKQEVEKYLEKLQECEERIVAKTAEWEERGMPEKYPEHCQQELFDVIKTVDHCVRMTFYFYDTCNVAEILCA